MAENETEKKNPSAKPGGAGNNQEETPQKDGRETEKKDGAKNAVFESIKHLTENVRR